jgi:hypothetical protein
MRNGLLVTRQFSMADQQAFAHASGDCNPMHMDEVAARRTQAGAPVVHGVHTVLWALDRLAAAGEPLDQLAALKVQFSKFVYLGREIALTVARRNDDGMKIALMDDGLTVSTLTLKFGARNRAKTARFEDVPVVTLGDAPLAPEFDAMRAMSGRLVPPLEACELVKNFPHLASALGEHRIIGLALLSTLVGMICPGQHSMFSGFSIQMMDADKSPNLAWRTERADERFRMVWLRVAGLGIAGEVSSWVRAEPVVPPDMTTLSTLVISGEFAGRTALIVGGSRGLGAVTAKLLAAGGARIIVTYATGKEEAEALVAEIRAAHGEPAATSLAFDMRSEAGLQLSSLPDITHLYYFATPRISHQSTAVFDLSVFEEFTRFYIDGFHALARWLIHNRKSLRHIFYPSSVFVTSHASGMTEYAMVKAAAEILCADLMAATGLSIAVPRIPRVLTDQTATVPPVETQDHVAVMLPLLRAENHAPS